LTEGKPKLVTLEPIGSRSADELLRFAASLERGSEHPLAAAIVQCAHERGVTLAAEGGFRSVTGKGDVGRIDGHDAALGNRRLMEALGVTWTAIAERAEARRREGQTVMFVAVDRQPAGLVGVADPIKATTPEALQLLRDSGLHIVMLTGDSRATAEAVARRLQIQAVQAQGL